MSVNKSKQVDLHVEHLAKQFGDLCVLNDISFDVKRGDVVSIIGPSGSGKSTLLRCLVHLETVTSGTIEVTGESMVKDGIYAPAAKLREICLCAGLVFQNFNLFPHFSVLRNLTEAQMCLMKRSRAEAETRAYELLAKMGLSDKANAYPCELSGGQQQRVSIARALALDPEILLFDEPTSALDPELTGEILKVIRELAKENMTMIIVTHEIAFARDVSSRVIFMDGGYIVEDGSAEQVIGAPENKRTIAFLERFSSEK